MLALQWLASVLRDAGLKVQEEPGWQTRGVHAQDVGTIFGVICHHTVGRREGNMPSLRVLRDGRPANPAKNRKALPGPLAQLGLARDGTFHVIAAGRANHAGAGSWLGVKSGNLHFIGVEAENTGAPDDAYPAPQLEAYHLGVAAILRHLQLSAERCIGHKEWAPGRKIDPLFDMNAFRADVARKLAQLEREHARSAGLRPRSAGRKGAGLGALMRLLRANDDA